MTVVPKLWPGATVVCIATGASLTQTDVEACRGLRTIVINNAYTVAPWAEAISWSRMWDFRTETATQ